jgi:hypothetical protein
MYIFMYIGMLIHEYQTSKWFNYSMWRLKFSNICSFKEINTSFFRFSHYNKTPLCSTLQFDIHFPKNYPKSFHQFSEREKLLLLSSVHKPRHRFKIKPIQIEKHPQYLSQNTKEYVELRSGWNLFLSFNLCPVTSSQRTAHWFLVASKFPLRKKKTHV